MSAFILSKQQEEAVEWRRQRSADTKFIHWVLSNVFASMQCLYLDRKITGVKTKQIRGVFPPPLHLLKTLTFRENAVFLSYYKMFPTIWAVCKTKNSTGRFIHHRTTQPASASAASSLPFGKKNLKKIKKKSIHSDRSFCKLKLLEWRTSYFPLK